MKSTKLLSLATFALAFSSANAADLTWDVPGGNPIVPGSGTWTNAAGNWTNGSGTAVNWAAANVAVFGGADGTYAITVGGTISAEKIHFTRSGYTLSSGSARTITLTSSGGTGVLPGLAIASGKTATIGANVLVQGGATTYVGQDNGTAGGTLNIEGTGATALGQVRTSTAGSSIVIDGAGTIVNVKTHGYFGTASSSASGSMGVGQFLLSDATLNVGGGTAEVFTTGSFQVGNNGKGTVNLNSGAIKVGATSTNGVVFGLNVNNVSANVFNLNGGTLTTPNVKKGAGTGSTATFNFDGGTLVANNATANTTFMEGLNSANVKVGGAKIETTGQNITINQALLAGSPSGGLTKSGTGTLTLGGANTYTGDTVIKAGTLRINTSTTIGSSSKITVGDTGSSGTVLDATTAGLSVGASQTLAGIGQVLATGQTVAIAGILAPGNSPGTLSMTVSNLDLGNATALAFELNPSDTTVGGAINDLVAVTGNLNLDGLLSVVATSGDFLSVVANTTWRLFNYSGTLTDDTLSLGSMPSLGSGLSWSIDTATTGQVNLSVIPEPSAALLGSLGFLALLRRRR